MNSARLPGFTADRSADTRGRHYYTTTFTTGSGAMNDVRPQRFKLDCDDLTRMIQHQHYLYGLDVLSGDHAAAVKRLQAIRDLEAWLVAC